MTVVLPLPASRFLTRDQAASYLGVSARTFDAEVISGMWPPALRRGGKSTALTWDRHLLDRAADRLSGLAESGTTDRALDASEARALEVSREPRPNGNQHRHKAPA